MPVASSKAFQPHFILRSSGSVWVPSTVTVVPLYSPARAFSRKPPLGATISPKSYPSGHSTAAASVAASVGASVMASVGASVAGACVGAGVVAGAQAAIIMVTSTSTPRILLILDISTSPSLLMVVELRSYSLLGMVRCQFVDATTSFVDVSTY